MELKIEYLDKTALKPYVNNAKIHTPEQVEQIKKSIREFGFNDPIAIWHDNEIVEGHGRLLAAMEINEVQTIPVIRLNGLTDKQRQAYMLVHNKLTMNTGFDFDLLQEELNSLDLDLSDFDLGRIDDVNIEDYFTTDPTPQEQTEKKQHNHAEPVTTNTTEIEYEEPAKRKIQCPHCGEWFKI